MVFFLMQVGVLSTKRMLHGLAFENNMSFQFEKEKTEN